MVISNGSKSPPYQMILIAKKASSKGKPLPSCAPKCKSDPSRSRLVNSDANHLHLAKLMVSWSTGSSVTLKKIAWNIKVLTTRIGEI